MHVPHLASTTFTALSHSCACRVSVSASCADHKGTKVKWPLWSAALTTRASRRDLTLVRRVRDESGYRLKQTRLDLGAPRSIRQHGPRLLLSFAFHGRRIFSWSGLDLFIVLSVSSHCLARHSTLSRLEAGQLRETTGGFLPWPCFSGAAQGRAA